MIDVVNDSNSEHTGCQFWWNNNPFRFKFCADCNGNVCGYAQVSIIGDGQAQIIQTFNQFILSCVCMNLESKKNRNWCLFVLCVGTSCCLRVMCVYLFPAVEHI